MNSSTKKMSRGVAGSFGDIIGDIASLAELQLALFKVDCAESGRRMLLSAFFMGTALFVFAGMFPIALGIIAAALYEIGEFSLTTSLSIAAATGIVIVILSTLLGYAISKNALATFDRSITETKRNVAWLKRLKNNGRGAASQQEMAHTSV